MAQNTLIDAHQHFWHPARGDYGWMPKNNAVLARQYSPEDLRSSMESTGVAGSVLVQAAPTVAESEYMLGIADSTPHVLAVVGWIDFEDRAAGELERLCLHPKFVGVRPMIQDLPDPDWMFREDVQWAYQAIIDLDLTFDALGFPKHMKRFKDLLQRYPQMRTVLDHCLKPQMGNQTEAGFKEWAADMSALARETSVYCKLSGLVTEAREDWTPEILRPYVDHILSEFGPQRVMWGSDWPVVRLRCEYETWFETAQSLTQHLSESERAAVFGQNAKEFYRLHL